MKWIPSTKGAEIYWNDSAHHDRLATERHRVVDFATASYVPEGGFGWLDGSVRRTPEKPVATWINARMTHAFSLARGFDDTDTTSLADHRIAALRGPLHDDGHPGFVYPLDWNDRPLVRERMHWVLAEAILTAAALHQRTTEDRYARWYDTFWKYARSHHVDADNGSWHHEVSPEGQSATSVWSGKPDAHHAYQAALLPTLPLAPAPAVLARETGFRR